MGNKCNGCCIEEDSLIHAKNLYELSEKIEEKNSYILNEENIYDKSFKLKVEKFIHDCDEYIAIFKSISNNCISKENFNNIKDTVNSCYYAISKNDEVTFEKQTIQLENSVKVKLKLLLGLKVKYL